MLPVDPRYVYINPSAEGSVLDCLMIKFSCLGLSLLSMKIRTINGKVAQLIK